MNKAELVPRISDCTETPSGDSVVPYKMNDHKAEKSHTHLIYYYYVHAYFELSEDGIIISGISLSFPKI